MNLTPWDSPLAVAGLAQAADHAGGRRDRVVLTLSERLRAGVVEGRGCSGWSACVLVAVTNQTPSETDIWSTWIIGAPNVFGTAGQLTRTRLFVAVVDGAAPNVVADRDGNGVFDEKDLALMGFHVISNVRKIDFTINGF